MWDPFSWSLSLGRVRGINVRMHVLFPVVALGLILRIAFKKDVIAGTWIDASMLMALLFFAVLLHEFGHCIGARLVDGDAHQILLWPLGGLAAIEVPHTPRANFIATAAGPAANLVICLVSGLLFLWLTDFHYRPTWNPLPTADFGGWYPYRVEANGAIYLYTWKGTSETVTSLPVIALARLFWVSWVMFLFNMVLVGFPMDAGRMFQCALWPRYGFRQSMVTAIYMGYVTALVLGVVAIFTEELLLLCLGLFIYVSCRQQFIILETGGEDSQFGDFSQGYTSLERDQPAPPRRRRQSFWQRWKQQRALKRMQREAEQREAEERRMDELLDKVQRQGQNSLTDEELRFLKRVSHKFRNRQ